MNKVSVCSVITMGWDKSEICVKLLGLKICVMKNLDSSMSTNILQKQMMVNPVFWWSWSLRGESWYSQYDPQVYIQSAEWLSPCSQRHEKVHFEKSCIITVLFTNWCHRDNPKEFVSEGRTFQVMNTGYRYWNVSEKPDWEHWAAFA